MKRSVLTLLVIVLLGSSNLAQAKKQAKDGSAVEIQYTGRLKDGRVFDTNINREALGFVIGKHKMLPKFEEAVIGMKVEEEKTFTIAAEDAYGEFSPNKVFKIYKDQLPDSAEIGKTMHYRIGGSFHPVRVIDIDDKFAYLDANHYLAGKDLVFDIKLLKVAKNQG